MPKKIVFHDNDGTEMELSLNPHRLLIVTVGRADSDECLYSGTILLDRQDIVDLIETLGDFVKEMPDSN